MIAATKLFVVLVFVMTACGGGGEDDKTPSDVTPTRTASPTPTLVAPLPDTRGVDKDNLDVATATPTASTEPSDGESVDEVPQDDLDRSDFVIETEELATATQAPDAEPVAETPPAEASPTQAPPTQAPPAKVPPDELEEGCLDTAPVADVTISDGTVLDPGETFTKIWRVRNTGDCEWSNALGELLWMFVGGDQMNGPSQTPIMGPVPPGGEYDVEVELTAPAEPGQYEGRWQAHDPNGDPFGVLFWVLIKVPGASPAVAQDGASPSGAADLAQQVWSYINGERDRHGLYQLAYDEQLALAAQAHAEDCSQRGSCSHTGSDGSDEAVRVQRVGYQGTVDESWVWSASPMDAVNWWLDEAPPNDWHRRMVLSDYLAQVGVGVAPAETGYYFIAVFGITGH